MSSKTFNVTSKGHALLYYNDFAKENCLTTIKHLNWLKSAAWPFIYLSSVISYIIWIAPRADKMNQILHCDMASLAGLAGKMAISCPLGIARCIPHENGAL